MEDFMAAKMYDEMISWDSRLSREIPVISEYFADLGKNATILDVACSSGRHSFALNEEGFQTIGVDISPHFIKLARQLVSKESSEELTTFYEYDASEPGLVETVGKYVDGAILLGNAIANMGNYSKGKSLLRNIFKLLRPGGKFFVQTVNRPLQPWYNPLRRKDEVIIQRIMVPAPEPQYEHNVVLHVNQIDPEKLEYVKKKADNLFFMYTQQEFQELVESIGFEVKAVRSGYNQEEVQEVDGETLIWKLVKPEIKIYPEGIELFQQYSNIDQKKIKERTLRIWQKVIQEDWYHCIRGYRFLYPRIKAHPKYDEIISSKASSPILDIGCNLGTDLRQLHVDGASSLYGVDISSIFIEMGYELFGDKGSCPIEFQVANVLEDEFLQFQGNNVVGGKFADHLGYYGAIHSGSLLHLLAKEEIQSIIKRMYVLLDDDGIVFGRTVGATEPKQQEVGFQFLHSIDSLATELTNAGFNEVEVFEMPRGGPIGESTTSTVLQLGFYARK